MKRIGLIGGTGWVATRDYYTRLNEKVGARLGGLHSADLVIRSLDFQILIDLRDDPARVEGLIAEAAAQLDRAGAQVLALASHSGHLYAGRIASATSLPLVRIDQVVAASLAAAGVARVGVLGTALMLESGLLEAALNAQGISVVIPPLPQRKRLDAAIFGELEHGRGGPLTRAALDECERGFAAAGVEDLLLACTELPFAYAGRRSALRIRDSVDMHCEAILAAAFA